MSTEADPQEERPAGSFKLESDEIEALEHADAEAEEDATAGRLVPLTVVLSALRGA